MKDPYSEFFWSALSRIRTKSGDFQCKSPYSRRIWENTDQKNFSRIVKIHVFSPFVIVKEIGRNNFTHILMYY